MLIPIKEVTNYIQTPEMYEMMQEKLNKDEMVKHVIKNTEGIDLTIEAVHDEDLDIIWSIFKDGDEVYNDIPMERLQSTLTAIVEVS